MLGNRNKKNQYLIHSSYFYCLGCPAGAYLKFSEIKARTCISLKSSSRSFREKYTASNEAPKFTQAGASVVVTEGNLIPVAGGVLVSDQDGNSIGAVGVSGAAADEDEYLAWVGVQRTTELKNICITTPLNHSCTTLASL